MRTTWNFFSAGQLHFGPGAVEQLGPLVRRLQANSALVVTDAALAAAGVVDPVAASLKAAGVAVHVFDGGQPEPALETADAAIEMARRVRPDAIVGLGGGSNMDLAKIAAVAYTHGGAPADYFHWDNVPGPVCPLVCVPTTAGTGSEVSHAAVLT
ncbi:MAG: iron-containing alcohol dehydrogenase, partial [Planctomycetales bacterium]|nr:iron-containing alcohol dehydrogenase [Planctomycetales bacterium]